MSKIVNARNTAERDSLLEERKFFTGRNDSLLAQVMREVDTSLIDQRSLHELISIRETYKANYRYLVTKLINNNDRDSAYIFLNKVFEPSFFLYQEKVASFITINKENYLSHSRVISNDVNQKSLFLLVFGFSPVLIFSIYLLILGAMLVYLLKK